MCEREKEEKEKERKGPETSDGLDRLDGLCEGEPVVVGEGGGEVVRHRSRVPQTKNQISTLCQRRFVHLFVVSIPC